MGDLFDATQEIGQWIELCEYLGVGKGVLAEIEYSRKSDSEKKHDCLTEYYNNHNPDWRKVVSVLYHYPIRNWHIACNIAMKYMKMEEEECIYQFSSWGTYMWSDAGESSIFSIAVGMYVCMHV